MKVSEQGFTLMEIIVALIVFSLLVLGLGQGLRFSALTWNIVSRTVEAGDSFEIIDRTLRQLISQIDPGGPTNPPQLSTGPELLAFLTRLPERPGIPSRRVEAVLAVNPNHCLVLRWRPFLRAGDLTPAAFAETELLPNVSRMELFFWHPEDGWLRKWESAGLPSLIRIRLSFQQVGKRRWPDIVIAPELDRP